MNIQSIANSITLSDVSFGKINPNKKTPKLLSKDDEQTVKKERRLALIGSVVGVTVPLLFFMNRQKIKNPFKVKYSIKEMLTMAACANIGGIALSSINETPHDIKKKWKEGAFQMVLTSAPMLMVDSSIKFCESSKNKYINNNFAKIITSIIGVTIGSKSAEALFNKLKSPEERHQKRKLQLKDMLANLDDIVAICTFAKIPLIDKLHVERALPFIYAVCGYRSGTGDKRELQPQEMG